jgi:hypothetical protein
MTTKQIYTEIPNYFVGDTEYFVKVFGYPEVGEIDFEVYNVEREYLFTLTSNRPDLSTSVLWRYLKGIPCDAITFCSLWGN